jgi:hypothetical protein
VIFAPYPLYAGKADMFSVGIDVRYVAPLLAKTGHFLALAFFEFSVAEKMSQNAINMAAIQNPGMSRIGPSGDTVWSGSLNHADRAILGSTPKADTLGLRCLGRISKRRLRWVVWLHPALPHHPVREVGARDGTARRE